MKKGTSQPQKALRRTIAVIMLVMLAVAMMFSTISLNITTGYTLSATNLMKQGTLNVYQQEVDKLLESISQQAYLFLLDDAVWELIYSDTLQPDYILLREVLQKVRNQYSMNTLVESMYFFDQNSYYVLADHYYKKNQFYDPIVFTDKFIQKRPISDVRTVADREIFSLIYRPLTTVKSNPVTIVVNISVEEIKKLLPFSDELGHFVMTNGSNEILYASSQMPHLHKLIHEFEKLSKEQGLISIDGESFLIICAPQSSMGTRLYIFQDYQTATHARAMIRSLAFPAISVALLGAGLLAMVSSFYLYRPMKKLISNLSALGYSASDFETHSEYALIGQAFDHLASSKKEIEIKYNEASQYQESYALQEFLINPVLNRPAFDQVLRMLNRTFSASMYTLFLVHLEAEAGYEFQHIPIPDQSVFFGIGERIVSKTSHNSIAILLNHALEQSAGTAILPERLRKWFDDHHITMHLVSSEPFVQLEELPTHFNHCDMALKQQLFLEYTDSHSLELNEAKVLVGHTKKQLYTAIKAGNEASAQQLLETLIDLYAGGFSPESTELLHHYLSDICLEIMNTAQNSETDLVQLPGYIHFRRLSMADTLSEIHAELSLLIHETMEHNSLVAQKRNENLIADAMRFIDENLTRNLSLDDVSRSVYLSTNYFCGLFKTETGKTVMDYVTEKRIELACKMLLNNPQIQINTVAEQLGYNSTQSFIRQFKKLMKSTPDQYRKENRESEE